MSVYDLKPTGQLYGWKAGGWRRGRTKKLTTNTKERTRQKEQLIKNKLKNERGRQRRDRTFEAKKRLMKTNLNTKEIERREEAKKKHGGENAERRER